MVSPTPSPSTSTTTIQAGPSRTLPLRASAPECDNLRKDEEEILGDSGYGSYESTQPASSHDEDGILLPLSKSESTRYFPGKLTEAQVNRFYVILPPIERLLVQHFARRKSLLGGYRRHKPMAIRPMLLGATILDAKPHIVVFCASEIRKRVKNFFDTEELVRAWCRNDSCPDSLAFGIAVCGFTPELRAGGLSVSVVWDTDPEMAAGAMQGGERVETKTRFKDTICGTPIQFHANGRQINATLGGIVKLMYEDGTWDLKGLTVAHSALELLQEPLEVSRFDDEYEDGGTPTNTDDDPTDPDSEGTGIKDSSDMSSEATQKSSQCDSWAFKNPQVLQEAILDDAALFATQSAFVEDFAFFDWALTPLSVFKQNKVPGEEFGRDVNSIRLNRSFDPWSKRLSNEQVIVICGSSGLRQGRLVPEPSRIIIGPGSLFTTAYMVQFTDGTLVDGDSGSWVVSETNLDLLGQVVATDHLGTAYFIPASDILRDIVNSGVAERVMLPCATDIQSKIRAMQPDVKMRAEELQKQHNEGKGKQAADALPSLSGAPNVEIPDSSQRPVIQRTRIEYAVRGPHTLSITVSSTSLIHMLDKFLEQGIEKGWFDGYSKVPGNGALEYRFAFDDSDDAPGVSKVFRTMIEGDLKTGQKEKQILHSIARISLFFQQDRLQSKKKRAQSGE